MINAFHFLLIIKSINYLDIYPKSKILKTKKSNMFQSIHFDIMITKRDIINCISSNISSSNVVNYLKKSNDPRNYKVDFSKVKNMLGFSADCSLDYGVKEIINAFEQNKFPDIDKNFMNYGN